MEVVFNSSVCKASNVSVEEAMILYISLKRLNVEDLLNSVTQKGLADKSIIDSGELILSEKQQDFITSILVDSQKLISPQLSRFDALSEVLISIYKNAGFKGKRPNTNVAWCDTPVVISKKLKIAYDKQKFTDEDAIEATQNYVKDNMFNPYMECLKYFIWKNLPDGEVRSSMLTAISNKGDGDSDSQDTGRLI